jgi:UDP-glucose 6-dehydrogenase
MSTDMKEKTTSPWIMHVKKFAKEKGIKYNEALKDPDLKIGYVKVERVKSKSSPKMEPMMMELNRNYDKLEAPIKVKKERKKKDVMVVEAPPMMIQTESGDLQQVPEASKKVRAKRQEKKIPAIM